MEKTQNKENNGKINTAEIPEGDLLSQWQLEKLKKEDDYNQEIIKEIFNK